MKDRDPSTNVSSINLCSEIVSPFHNAIFRVPLALCVLQPRPNEECPLTSRLFTGSLLDGKTPPNCNPTFEWRDLFPALSQFSRD